MSYIALDLNGLTLTINRIGSSEKPRKLGEISVDRTANGTPIILGSAYEEPHRWEFNCLLNQPEKTRIEAIYQEHRRLIRNYQTNYSIILTDTCSTIEETGTRTRAIAPAPYNIVTNPYDGVVSYYAKFNVLFGAAPTFSQNGRFVECQLVFEETGAKVAP